jgi:hypothetical protein
MAHDYIPNELSLLGFVQWGDFANLTTYRSKRGKLVWFEKTWPDKPPSPKQEIQREIWRAAASQWRELTDDQRHQWALAARRASLCMTGYNLWIYWYISFDDATIRTLEHQTHTTLLPIGGEHSGSG